MKSNKYSLLNKNPTENQSIYPDIQLQTRTGSRFNEIPYSKFQEELEMSQKQTKKAMPSGKIIKNSKKANEQSTVMNESAVLINKEIDHNPFNQQTSNGSPFNSYYNKSQPTSYPTFEEHHPYKNNNVSSNFNNNKNANVNNTVQNNQSHIAQNNNQYNTQNSNNNNGQKSNNAASSQLKSNAESKTPYQFINPNFSNYSQVPFSPINQQHYQYPYHNPHNNHPYQQYQPYQSVYQPNQSNYQPNQSVYQPIDKSRLRQQPMSQPLRSQIKPNPLSSTVNQPNPQSFIKNKQQNPIKTSNIQTVPKKPSNTQQYSRLNTSQSNVSRLNSSIIRSGLNGAEIDIQNPFVPPVVGECQGCGQKQHIPGDEAQFYCYKCKKLNLVQPKFGLFICGNCRGKVSYPYTLSDHIQCNICYTVNKVPLLVQSTQKLNKSKIIKLSDDNDETQSILPKELKQMGEQNHNNQSNRWTDSEFQFEK